MRRCPKCNAEITNDKAKYCKKCGTKLPPFEPQTNEENEDVTRLVHEGIPLTGKQEAPGSNTGGGMEVNPPTGPNPESVVPTGEKPESNSIVILWAAILFIVFFVGGLLLFKTAGHEESLEADNDTAYVDTTCVDTCVVDTTDIDSCADGSVSYVDEVEEISPEEENLTLLKEGIAEANSEFPMTAEEGIVVKKCYLDGDYVMYNYECDEDVLDMDLMEQNKYEVKQNIKKNLKNADADAVMFKQLCLKANKGFGYKFIGDRTGKTVFIRITCQELESMRGNSKIRRS